MCESQEDLAKRLEKDRKKTAIFMMKESKKRKAIYLVKMKKKLQEKRDKILEERSKRNLDEAVKAILNKRMGYEVAAERFNVNKDWLKRHIERFKTLNETEPSNEDHSSGNTKLATTSAPKSALETVAQPNPASETVMLSKPALESLAQFNPALGTLATANFSSQHISRSEPTDVEIQIKQERDSGDELAEETRQMGSVSFAPPLQPHIQMLGQQPFVTAQPPTSAQHHIQMQRQQPFVTAKPPTSTQHHFQMQGQQTFVTAQPPTSAQPFIQMQEEQPSLTALAVTSAQPHVLMQGQQQLVTALSPVSTQALIKIQGQQHLAVAQSLASAQPHIQMHGQPYLVAAQPSASAQPPTSTQPQPTPQRKRTLVVANHQHNFMSSLAYLWESGKLCDASIGNGSSVVKVHKIVLSVICPKLLSRFSKDFFCQKFMQINFPETVSHTALVAFAEYMYRGIINLNWSILEELKIIARKLEMVEFELLCDSHLPDHMRESTSTAASFNDIPLIQTTMPNSAMPSSLAPHGHVISTTMQSNPSINNNAPLIQTAMPDPAINSSLAPYGSIMFSATQSDLSIDAPRIDIKQEIPDQDLAQDVNWHGSEIASLSSRETEKTVDSVINPIIKTEQVGPEDDEYGYWTGSSNNQSFTSTISLPSSFRASSSTEYAIPFKQTTGVESTRLKAPHFCEAPLLSDYSSVPSNVGIAHTQLDFKNVDSSQTSGRQPALSIRDGRTACVRAVHSVGFYTAEGTNLPLQTTPDS